MPAPQGELLTVVVDGEEVQVQIEPKILSRKAQESLSRVVRKQIRDNVWRDMEDLRAAEISEDTKAEIRAEYRQLLHRVPSFEETYDALNNSDGVVALLEVVSNLTHEDAKKVVADPENLIKISTAISEVVNREAEAVKNL